MLVTAFLLGLMGSWHCIAMCGPIALMVPKGKSSNKYLPLGLYHLGKIIAYALVGLGMGSLTMFFTSFDFQAVILILAGIVMILIAIFPIVLNRIENKGSKFFAPVNKLKIQMRSALNKERSEYAFYVGFLNGFIPCGMVYLAGIGAMAQTNIFNGILFMVFFGLGTLPFMSVFILISQRIKSTFVKNSRRLRTVGLLLIGLFMLYRGYSNLNQDLQQDDLKGKAFHVCY